MESWAFLFWFSASGPARLIAAQSEEACVTMAKSITARLPMDGMCVNEFDGTVLWFTMGKQVDKL